MEQLRIEILPLANEYYFLKVVNFNNEILFSYKGKNKKDCLIQLGIYFLLESDAMINLTINEINQKYE